MSWRYEPKGYGAFETHLTQFGLEDKRLILDAIQNRLREDPVSEKKPVSSEMLHGLLDCIRRIHVGPSIIIAYMVCDECKRINCDSKINCLKCYAEPSWRVKMIAVLPRDTAYKELLNNWPLWIHFEPK